MDGKCGLIVTCRTDGSAQIEVIDERPVPGFFEYPGCRGAWVRNPEQRRAFMLATAITLQARELMGMTLEELEARVDSLIPEKEDK